MLILWVNLVVMVVVLILWVKMVVRNLVSGVRMFACVLMIVFVDVVDCVCGGDDGYGCDNYYLVAEPMVAYGLARYVPSMQHPPQACNCCCA